MNELVESVSLKKLPVLATIRETLQVSWQHREILVPWIVGCTIFAGGFCFLIEHLFLHFIWVFANWNPIWIKASFVLLSAFPILIISTLFCVLCHRLVLTDGKEESLYPITFGKGEWRFLGWNLALLLAAICIALVSLIISFFVLGFFEALTEAYGKPISIKTFLDYRLFYVVFLPIVYYLVAPFSLVLPATAIDLKPTLNWPLKQTKRNEWRLALIFGGLPFIFGFLYCPPSLLTWLQIDQFMVVKHVIRPFLVYLVTPIMVIALSIAFRELTNWEPSSQVRESA